MIATAIAQWQAVLTNARVSTDAATLTRYARVTGFTSTRPAAVIWPTSTEEVVQTVRIANEHRVALYPISTGKNWGYGDSCATTADQVIVDLGRMNRILEVNTQLGYAVVEPGVTQGQLSAHLRENKTGLWMDATGAGPAASIVGNFADRGFGMSRYADHYLSCGGLQVVLPDGHLLHTGMGHYKNAQAKHVYKYGIGPILDGLFSQSNLGIITQLTVYLMPEPEAFCGYLFMCKQDSDLEAIIDTFGRLRLQGVAQSAVQVFNDLRAVSANTLYPWHLTGGQGPLTPDIRRTLRDQFGLGAWVGTGAITGSFDMVEGIKKKIRRELKRINGCQLLLLNDGRLRALERVANVAARLGNKDLVPRIKSLKAGYEMLKGIPSTVALPGSWWRVKKDSAQVDSLDPLDHDAGMAWVAPVVPTVGKIVRHVVDVMDAGFRRHGFDLLLSTSMLTERSTYLIGNLTFDRTNAAEVAKARACYDEVYKALKEEGYYPYRAGIEGFGELAHNSHEFWDVVNRLKKALDPNGIVSPGRYQPGRS